MATATAGSEVAVAAPQLQEPVTGILAQVPVIGGVQGDRWLAGLSLVPEVAGQPEFRDLCSPTALTGGTGTRAGTRIVQPFELILRDRCSTWGFPENDYEGRATRGLQAKRSWAVEREWEKGEMVPGNLHLAETYTSPNPTSTILASSVAVSPVNAMALLDEAIGNAANVIGRGMIWCTPFVAAQWKGAGLLNYETIDDDAGVGRRAVVLSPAGNYVVICGGMEGRGMDATVPGSHTSQWAYATDPVVVVQGTPKTLPSSFLEALDGQTNTVVFRQEQWFAILWAGLLHVSVKIATDTPAGGGGGGGPTSAVTIADGADVAEGTTSDLATANTVIGRLKKLVSLLPTALGTLGGLKVESVGCSTGTATPVANSITSVTLLAANANRKGATIFNDDTAVTGATLRIKFGATASATSFVYAIPPQGYYEVPFGYTGVIDGIASAASGSARITELT